MNRGTSTPKAIVAVHESESWKLAHGIVLPEGYALVNRLPWYSDNRLSMMFVVESEEIPPTPPAHELPYLTTLAGYQCIVVVPWDA